MAARLFREGVISESLANDYLRVDKITVQDVLSGRMNIEFSGKPV